MTDATQYAPENDDRGGKKPRRAETLGQQIPPHGGAVTIPVAGEFVKRIPVGRLETVPQWRRLVGRIMRAMLKGEMPLENGTKLIWAARVGADLAKQEQEQRELEELNAKLARLEGGNPAQLPGAPRAQRADDLTDEELADIARNGRAELPAPAGEEL